VRYYDDNEDDNNDDNDDGDGLNNWTVITNMELDETCKYLGIEESEGIDNSQMKDKLVREYVPPSVLTNSQDRAKLKEQDHTLPTLLLYQS
jgi:hypothetical protein